MPVQKESENKLSSSKKSDFLELSEIVLEDRVRLRQELLLLNEQSRLQQFKRELDRIEYETEELHKMDMSDLISIVDFEAERMRANVRFLRKRIENSKYRFTTFLPIYGSLATICLAVVSIFYEKHIIYPFNQLFVSSSISLLGITFSFALVELMKANEKKVEMQILTEQVAEAEQYIQSLREDVIGYKIKVNIV